MNRRVSESWTRLFAFVPPCRRKRTAKSAIVRSGYHCYGIHYVVRTLFLFLYSPQFTSFGISLKLAGHIYCIADMHTLKQQHDPKCAICRRPITPEEGKSELWFDWGEDAPVGERVHFVKGLVRDLDIGSSSRVVEGVLTMMDELGRGGVLGDSVVSKLGKKGGE